MKESMEEISACLKEQKENTELIFGLVKKAVLGNGDFRLIRDRLKGDDIFPEIEEECSVSLSWPDESILEREAITIVEEIEELEKKNIVPSKRTQIRIISQALSNDNLFEGICLTIPASDDDLKGILEGVGCSERYLELEGDPVFRARRDYVMKINQYAEAAVNLYGVLHLYELCELIEGYEHFQKNRAEYSRPEGKYRNTLLYNPGHLCPIVLMNLIGTGFLKLICSLDGIVMNGCFEDDFSEEIEELSEYAKKHHNVRPLEDDNLTDFWANQSHASYRALFYEAQAKPAYHPRKKEFLKYEDEDYYEVTDGYLRLKMFLKREYHDQFEDYAEKYGMENAEEAIDSYMDDLHWEYTDNYKEWDDRDVAGSASYAIKQLEAYGIIAEGIDEANRILMYAMDMANSTRLWANHGNTPNEMMSTSGGFNPKNLVVTPGSSQAAEMLKESRGELSKMGIHVDLDSSAAEIPAYRFDQGIGGGMQPGIRKIYPNDPCPCGSGKKYKKCCGTRLKEGI